MTDPEPTLATSRPERDRWPSEPMETHEPGERDELGRFLISVRGLRIHYTSDDDTEGREVR